MKFGFGSWYPIETLPDECKDGRSFLAFEVIGPMDEKDEDGSVIRSDLYRKGCVVAYWVFGGVVPYPWNNSFVTNREFTHWMPLPKAPRR